MKIQVAKGSLTSLKVDVLALAVPAKRQDRNKALEPVLKAMGAEDIEQLLKDEAFEAKRGQMLKIPGSGRVKARWLLLVGVGELDDQARIARELGLRLARVSKQHKSAAILMQSNDPDTLRQATEGVVGGMYRYVEYKSDAKKIKSALRTLTLLIKSEPTRQHSTAVRHGQVVADYINFARDLVNGPPNEITPLSLARIASAEAKKLGLTCKSWGKAKLQQEGMNLFLAVNQGSAIEPRMLHIAYKPRGAKKRVVYVGKGLTFDAGGLCLKPAKSMLDMKCDMAGAAATLGIVFAAAKLKLKVEVHAVVGATENMTGAKAYRPGDIYTSLEGKTVEIINTDAEGRLVLADVLTWATKLKPDYMIDHATLTGACMVALGPWTAGLYSDDEKLAQRYLEASEHEGESFWKMPLNKELRSSLKSHVADLKHVGGAYGGSITAALFLKEFVGKSRWMHLDIAGPAFLEGTHGRHPKGGTGFGVATGVRFLESL